jgi:type VI protein secretion system component VasK
VSSTARWVICAVCAVLGVIALIYAVMYLAVPIHSLPGFVPGKKVGYNGHYHKRALLMAVIGIVLLAIAAFVGWPARRGNAAPAGSIQGPTTDPAPGPATVDDTGGSPNA